MNVSNYLPTQLRKALDNGHYSKKALALELGVSPSTISNWVSGKKSPNLENLLMLSKLLNLSLCWLLNNRGPMHLNGPTHLSLSEESLITQLREQKGLSLEDSLDLLARTKGYHDSDELKSAIISKRILDNVTLPSAILDQHYTIIKANQQFFDLLALPEELIETLLKTNFITWLVNENQAECLLKLKQAELESKAMSLSCNMIRYQSSERVSVNISIVPYQHHAHKVTALYIFSKPLEKS